MLKIRDLHSFYGSIEAIKGIDIDVRDDQICCILGANGAGKSTLLKSISRVVNTTGTIQWDGTELSKLSTKKVAQLGITHVPEGRLVFPGLTVYENLEMGTINWHGFFGRESYTKDIEIVFSLFPQLKERKDQRAWSLSGGEQQMLAIGRGLMSRPHLLMLDEPSMGLAPILVEELFEKIVEIGKNGVSSILLIEQNAKIALEVSDYAYVMETGNLSIHGSADELRNDSRVADAYLGKKK